MTQTYYYKFLGPNLSSQHDSNFYYPSPRKDKSGKWHPTRWIEVEDYSEYDHVCGKGLHLMKACKPTLYALYTGNVYLAQGKGLLGEDDQKARFKQVRLIRPIKFSEIFYARAPLQCAYLESLDLSDAYLRGADLAFATLRYANLTKATLIGATLAYANLDHANIYDAELKNADLAGADLRNTNLAGADLTNANLRGANLTGANLSYAYLTGADLTNANIKDANLAGAVNQHTTKGKKLEVVVD